MFLSVIIPTYKRPSDLKRLLESLSNQTEIPNEILLVIGPGDIESSVVAEEMAQKISSIYIIHAHKASVIHALNLGLCFAHNEIICLLDDDVWLPQDWSIKIRNAFTSDNLIGAYGGKDYLQLDDPRLSNPALAPLVGVFRWDGFLIGNHHCGSINSPIQVDVLKGANLSFRRSAFPTMKIDLSLESRGAEICWEIDICLTIKKNPYKIIYDNNNYVLHYGSPRLDYDNRNEIFSPAWPGRTFNEAFVMAKFRPHLEVILFFIKSSLIGSRAHPGIIWTVLLIPKYKWKIVPFPLRKLLFLYRGLIRGFESKKDLQKNVLPKPLSV